MPNTLPTFEQFLAAYGLRIWRGTAVARGQRHHGGQQCPTAKPNYLGGSGQDHECETDFDAALLEARGKWWG